MPKAIWNNVVVAQTDRFETVENTVYFPPESLDMQYFQPSSKLTTCSWKGTASYYNVVVDGQVNRDAAWYYPRPKDAVANITGYVGFWHGVKIVD